MKLVARCKLEGAFLVDGGVSYVLQPGDAFEAGDKDAEAMIRQGTAEQAPTKKKAKKPPKE